MINNETESLKVKPSDAFFSGEDEIIKFFTFIGGSRDPDAPTLSQLSNVNSGEIHLVNGAEVKTIVPTTKS